MTAKPCDFCGAPSRMERTRYCSVACRLWSRVDFSGPCWLWVSTVSGASARGNGGYGNVVVNGKYVGAHRLSYTLLVGPIPDGLELDHLCRVRHCVNPDHLEPVTRQVNALRGFSPASKRARQTHCKRGHEFTPENTVYSSKGWRNCRECARIRKRNQAPAQTAHRNQRARELYVPIPKRTHCSRGHDLAAAGPFKGLQCPICYRSMPCAICGKEMYRDNLARHVRDVHGRESGQGEAPTRPAARRAADTHQMAAHGCETAVTA